MQITPLHSGWTVTEVGAVASVPADIRATRMPAIVPGCVHLDLRAAAVIPDPYLDRNEEALSWIGDGTWRYETSFTLTSDDLAGHDHHELAFEGLDTIAEVRLNDVEIARTANMHRRYDVDVTGVVREGANLLQVTFLPVREYTAQVREEVGEFPASYDQPFNYVRKMASNFGWDWGPVLVTAGIWKAVSLRSWSTARFAEVRPQLTFTEADGTRLGRVDVDVELSGDADAEVDGAEVVDARIADLEVEVSIGGVVHSVTVPAGHPVPTITVEVPDVELWWPREWGDQRRYDLAVTLRRGSTVLDRRNDRVGFRSIVLNRRADDEGESFELEVNGRPLFVRGVNWIPDDCFVAGIDRIRYETRLAQTAAANVNLVRVWGGGIYEKREFYDVCDEMGLLVWQDFAFACAAYAEVEPLRSEIVAEARDNVVRLMPHPSLVVWNGVNESIWGHADWGWQEVLGERPWGLGYYLDVLPGVVREVDPSRVYWPGSPYSGSPDIHPNDPSYGTMHQWDVWNQLDYTAYAGYRPRFVAEFGFQGPPNWSTLERAISERPLRYDSDTFLAHQKAEDGNRKLADGMAPHLPAPRGRDSAEQMADWHYLTQVNQARAVEFGIRHLRALDPVCRGSIVWQINDCWPVTSWAAIDGDGRLKPLWYALRRSYAPVLVTVDATTRDAVGVAISNESLRAVSDMLRVERLHVDGTVLAQTSLQVTVESGSTTWVGLETEVAQPASPADELLRVRFDGTSDIRFFTEVKDAALPPARFTAGTERTRAGLVLTVTAETVLRDLVIAADRIDADAVVDDQLITLLPGEHHRFSIETTADVDDPRWLTAPVIRCVNDVVLAL
ncbi:MAG: hypothetical protein RI885_1895 [Actinomycetota bacterium]|jgi:beta-mannosidase